MPKSIEIRRVGLTVELLLHKEYGVRGRELVAQTLEANPGVAALGPELPMGITIILPDLPPQQTKPVPVITLFGVANG